MPINCGISSSWIPQQQIKRLSRGQRARAGLLIALAHRPDLLILDEPSSGLDPVVRNDILSAIIRTVADEGRTVLFSSHLLDEVERVADWVAFLHHGRVALSAPLHEILHSHRRLVLRFEMSQSTRPDLPGMLSYQGEGREWTVLCNGGLEELRAAAARAGGRVVEEETPTLDEIFLARAQGAPRLGVVPEGVHLTSRTDRRSNHESCRESSSPNRHDARLGILGLRLALDHVGAAAGDVAAVSDLRRDSVAQTPHFDWEKSATSFNSRFIGRRSFMLGPSVLSALGKPEHRYTLPASNFLIVTTLMACAMATVFVQYAVMALSLNALFDVGWPVLGPSLLAAVLVAWCQAMLWSTSNSTGLQVLACAVSTALLGIAIVVWGPPDRSWMDPLSNVGPWHFLPFAVSAAICVAVGTFGFGKVWPAPGSTSARSSIG